MASNVNQARIAMRDVFYNEHCWIQQAAMRAALDLIPSYPDSNELAVIDYGCSQGANSIEALNKVISTLPNGAMVRIFWEDTAFNDFSTLAKTIESNISVLASANKSISVFPAMVPAGFYRQVLPDASADLGFAWSSLNYLETVPTVAIDPAAAPADLMAARHKAFSAAASKDIVKLLRLRAAEIREGGYLIAAIGGHNPTDDARPTNTGFMPLQAAMLKMVDMGRLSKTELMQMALFPTHERTIEEVRVALDDYEVAPLWEVDSLEPKLIEHPAWAVYQSACQSSDEHSTKIDVALREYAYTVVANMVSSSGWFWVDTLRKLRPKGWNGGESFLEDLTRLAVEECVESFPNMRVEIWYTYVKLRRTSKK